MPTLLALRKCVRADSTKVARLIETHPSTVRNRLDALRDQGIIRGYVPDLDPLNFGKPHLIQIDIDSARYRFPEEITKTVEALSQFFLLAVGHAPLSIFVFQDSDSRHCVRCVTMAYDIEKVINDISQQQNIARECISTIELDTAEGIPIYNGRSLPDEMNGGYTEW